MDYLTNLYKHRAEQLQEQIFILENKIKMLSEAPTTYSGSRQAIYPGSMPNVMGDVTVDNFMSNFKPQQAPAADPNSAYSVGQRQQQAKDSMAQYGAQAFAKDAANLAFGGLFQGQKAAAPSSGGQPGKTIVGLSQEQIDAANNPAMGGQSGNFGDKVQQTAAAGKAAASAGTSAIANLGRPAASDISSAAADFNQSAMQPGGVYKVDASGYVQSYTPAAQKATAAPQQNNVDVLSATKGLLDRMSAKAAAVTPVTPAAPAAAPAAPVSASAPSMPATQRSSGTPRVMATDNPLLSTFEPDYDQRPVAPKPPSAPAKIQVMGGPAGGDQFAMRQREEAKRKLEKEMGYNPVRTAPVKDQMPSGRGLMDTYLKYFYQRG